MNIYDIAKKSGVSIATISRVLNGGKNVSKKTYDKVMHIIQEEGYTPNVFARGLGLDTMQTIGILVTDVADPSYAAMVSVLTSELRNLGYNIILSCTGYELENKKKELRLLLDKRVDAVFLAGSAQQELQGNDHIAEAAKAVPVIMVNGYINAPGIINIAANESQSLYQAVTLLAGEGYLRPLYLYNHRTYSGLQKLNGFEAAIRDLGRSDCQDTQLLLSGTLTEAAAQLGRLMDEGMDFDSVVAAEDLLAVAALKALEERKLKKPVIGFNNSLLALVSTPTLTSIDNMQETICKLAVQMYYETLQGKEVSPRVTIDCKLVWRQSFQQQKKSE